MTRTAYYILFTLFCWNVLFATAQEQNAHLSALRVDTTPAAAELYLNGQGPFTTPYVSTDLKPGTHLITIQTKGFQTHRQSITLAAGERVPLQIELEPLTGLVLIHTIPADVEVKVNNLNKGTTPLLLTDLPVGQHTLHLSKPGFIDKTIALAITGRSPQHINETLMPSSATLAIASTPPGARITLNGASHGTTPATIETVPEGTAMLELQLEGYRPFAETLKLVAGQRAQLSVELVPIPATMRVVSIPTAARIYVNNQFQGESPLSLENLPPGEYRIRGELPGYEPTARTVRLANGANQTEELRLESNSGKLVVVTQPAGVTVFIDGEDRGTTTFKPDQTDNVSNPLTIDLVPVGEREVQLVATGYFPLTFTATINKNETTILQPRELRRQFIPNLEVRTRREVYRGVYVETLPNGDIRIEVRPGVFRRISRNDIISQRPLQRTALPE
ncbi:MAG: PEGA domain-containing protein [Kiritimatiellia bacterium]